MAARGKLFRDAFSKDEETRSHKWPSYLGAKEFVVISGGVLGIVK